VWAAAVWGEDGAGGVHRPRLAQSLGRRRRGVVVRG